MANPMRISARVDIDASGAKAGAAEANTAVSSIGSTAEAASAKLEKLQQTASEGLRTPLAVVGGTQASGAAEAAAAALERLRAKYDPVIAAQLRFRQRVDEINAAEAAGAVTAGRAIELRQQEKVSYDALISSINNVAAARKAAAEAAVARQTITPDRGADIAAYGAELDRLRAKYNPLYAVIVQYKAAQAEVRQAHAIGAISADEMTAALQRQRQATLATIDAIKGRNTALKQAPNAANQNFQTASLAFQMQDVITTAPSMPWYTVALQQGPQVAAVMDSLDDKAKGLKLAFLSLISPWSLISVAAVGAAAFAIQYFSKARDGANSATELLERHAAAISDLKERYGEAASGIREFVLEGQVVAQADLEDRIRSARETLTETAKEIASFSSSTLTMFAPLFKDIDTGLTQGVQKAFNDLRQSIRDGEPDLLAFRAALSAIQSNDAYPAAIREWAKETKVLDDDTLKLARALPSMQTQLELIGGAASAQVAGVSQLSRALQELSRIGMPALSDAEKAYEAYQKALSADPNSRSAQIAYDAAMERIRNQNPTVINSDGNQTSVPIPDTKPITLGDAPSKTSESAARSAANAYRDLIKSADDRIAQMKLETQVAGQTGVAADTLRFQLDLLQNAEDKGRSLTPKQVEAINARVESFKKYAQEAAKARLSADLLFERQQLGRSTFDQQIASTLRGAGLAIDFDSYEAGLIRTNLQLQYMRDLAGEATSTFFSGIEQGKSVLESLGDAGVSALKRIADTMLNDVLNSIFAVKSASGSSGGGLFGSILGGLGSLLGFSGGGGSNYSWASGGDFDISSPEFAGGGYTGDGGKYEEAGTVHRREIVWSEEDIARNGGVAKVDAMRRGYGDTGATTASVTPLYSAGQMQAFQAASGGATGAAAAGGKIIKIEVNVTAARGNAEIREMVAEGVREGLEGYDANLPDRIDDIKNNDRWR